MRVLDMRLFVFITLILLTAAMPANCAEEPTVWFGLVTGQDSAAQARYGLTTAPAGTLRRIVYAPYGRTPVAFAHILRDFNDEASTFDAVDQVLDEARRALAAAH